MKNIVFDIGMVLVDFHWPKTMRELGIPEEAIEHLGKNMVNDPLWKHYDLNDMPEEELIQKFCENNPGYEKYIHHFLSNMEHVITMFEGADIWLKGLKEKGYNIYLLSNYPERMFGLHIPLFKFLPYVDGRVVSYEYKVVKPDPEIYNILCKKYDIDPKESIFLDDRLENIEAAKALGFSGIHVTDPFAVRIELDNLLEAK